jgi:hypothetical protein
VDSEYLVCEEGEQGVRAQSPAGQWVRVWEWARGVDSEVCQSSARAPLRPEVATLERGQYSLTWADPFQAVSS